MDFLNIIHIEKKKREDWEIILDNTLIFSKFNDMLQVFVRIPLKRQFGWFLYRGNFKENPHHTSLNIHWRTIRLKSSLKIPSFFPLKYKTSQFTSYRSICKCEAMKTSWVLKLWLSHQLQVLQGIVGSPGMGFINGGALTMADSYWHTWQLDQALVHTYETKK